MGKYPTDFWDLDRAILINLPVQGAKLGKYLPDARAVVDIKKALKDDTLTSDIISTRLRLMRSMKFVVNIPVAGGRHRGSGWQRTRLADQALNGTWNGGEPDESPEP